ncbi:MAG: nicotinate phosphoribosyltransferase [Chloroflexi bacterium]|nr:nicotinate phosphoribosyltransferase [Chloroflexota bacterium]
MTQSAFHIARADLGLFTDLYELTMAQTYFDEGMFGDATFDLFVRSYPPNRGYLVCAGLEDVLEFLEGVSFGDGARQYLRELGMFSEKFLDYLGNLSFNGTVRAIPEGRIFFCNEPVLQVTAPIIAAQLVETLLINRLNLQSLQATKAARCAWAAQGRTVSDFGARRAPGVDGALTMARAGYIGGFQSTSNVMAARRYGLPPAGTMAHSMITAYPTELEAFRAYAKAFPHRTILLLDTYDTIEGAYNAAQVGKELEEAGHRLVGVRLDSGDYLDLSKRVRGILDDAGLGYVKIVASGGLDEYEIARLVEDGAPIDIFGVGTRVSVSADAPYTDMSYKLACYEGRPVMKLSPDKVSPPGTKQVYRFKDAQGNFEGDIVALDEENLPGGEALLETVMERGGRTRPAPTLSQARERFSHDFERLREGFKRIENPPRYPVVLSNQLQLLTEQTQNKLIEQCNYQH